MSRNVSPSQRLLDPNGLCRLAARLEERAAGLRVVAAGIGTGVAASCRGATATRVGRVGEQLEGWAGDLRRRAAAVEGWPAWEPAPTGDRRLALVYVNGTGSGPGDEVVARRRGLVAAEMAERGFDVETFAGTWQAPAAPIDSPWNDTDSSLEQLTSCERVEECRASDEDLARLTSALDSASATGRRVVVFGYSQGGFLISYLLHRRPDLAGLIDQVVLIAPSAAVEGSFDGVPVAMARPLMNDVVAWNAAAYGEPYAVRTMTDGHGVVTHELGGDLYDPAATPGIAFLDTPRYFSARPERSAWEAVVNPGVLLEDAGRAHLAWQEPAWRTPGAAAYRRRLFDELADLLGRPEGVPTAPVR